MRVLVSNDDGVDAPGIRVLAERLAVVGEVTVVAPDRDRSGASNSLTLDMPIRVIRQDETTWRVHGTPTDCVHVAITGMLEREPDIVVSGINNTANLGDDVIYSGTVAAAMEGFLFGVPAIAFSLVDKGWAHLDAAAATARAIVEQVLRERPLGAGAEPWLLSVNIPNRPDAASRPRMVTRLGRRHASEPVQRQQNPRGETIYWIGPAGDAREAGEGSDFHATASGCVSITPLQVDLTHHAALGRWREQLAGVPAAARGG